MLKRKVITAFLFSCLISFTGCLDSAAVQQQVEELKAQLSEEDSEELEKQLGGLGNKLSKLDKNKLSELSKIEKLKTVSDNRGTFEKIQTNVKKVERSIGGQGSQNRSTNQGRSTNPNQAPKARPAPPAVAAGMPNISAMRLGLTDDPGHNDTDYGEWRDTTYEVDLGDGFVAVVHRSGDNINSNLDSNVYKGTSDDENLTSKNYMWQGEWDTWRQSFSDRDGDGLLDAADDGNKLVTLVEHSIGEWGQWKSTKLVSLGDLPVDTLWGMIWLDSLFRMGDVKVSAQLDSSWDSEGNVWTGSQEDADGDGSLYTAAVGEMVKVRNSNINRRGDTVDLWEEIMTSGPDGNMNTWEDNATISTGYATIAGEDTLWAGRTYEADGDGLMFVEGGENKVVEISHGTWYDDWRQMKVTYLDSSVKILSEQWGGPGDVVLEHISKNTFEDGGYEIWTNSTIEYNGRDVMEQRSVYVPGDEFVDEWRQGIDSSISINIMDPGDPYNWEDDEFISWSNIDYYGDHPEFVKTMNRSEPKDPSDPSKGNVDIYIEYFKEELERDSAYNYSEWNEMTNSGLWRRVEYYTFEGGYQDSTVQFDDGKGNGQWSGWDEWGRKVSNKYSSEGNWSETVDYFDSDTLQVKREGTWDQFTNLGSYREVVYMVNGDSTYYSSVTEAVPGGRRTTEEFNGQKNIYTEFDDGSYSWVEFDADGNEVVYTQDDEEKSWVEQDDEGNDIEYTQTDDAIEWLEPDEDGGYIRFKQYFDSSQRVVVDVEFYSINSELTMAVTLTFMESGEGKGFVILYDGNEEEEFELVLGTDGEIYVDGEMI